MQKHVSQSLHACQLDIKGVDSVRGKLSAGRTAFIWPFSEILRPFLKSLGSQLSVDTFESQIGLKLAELWAKK